MNGWRIAGVAPALLASSLAEGGLADEPDCTQPSGPMEIDICQSRQYDRIDESLNRTYRQTLEVLDRGEICISACADAKQHLRAAQRAWIRFRDEDCKATYAIAVDGTGRNAARMDCLIEHTRTRIRQLQQLQGI